MAVGFDSACSASLSNCSDQVLLVYGSSFSISTTHRSKVAASVSALARNSVALLAQVIIWVKAPRHLKSLDGRGLKFTRPIQISWFMRRSVRPRSRYGQKYQPEPRNLDWPREF